MIFSQRRKGTRRAQRGQEMRGSVGVLLILYGICLGVVQGWGQIDSVKVSSDSTESLLMPPVTVIGSRLLSRRAKSIRPTAVITATQIEEGGARDLADALLFSPGLFVRRYGGPGGLRTVSLRGTPSEGTALMIDGVRYRSSAEGGFDLGNIPAETLQEVEVIRGGDAALFGANSLGGAINVVTANGAEETEFRATAGAGSFGEQSAGLSGTGALGTHRFDGSVHYTKSEGSYPFDFNEFGRTETITRTNSDFSNLFARLGWSLQPEETGWHTNAAILGYQTSRGVPGPVVQGRSEGSEARLDEDDLFALAQIRKSLGSSMYTLSANGRLNRLRYRDSDDRSGGKDGVDNTYNLANGTLLLRNLWFPDVHSSLATTIEAEVITLQGENLDPSAGDEVSRSRIGGFVQGSRSFPEIALGESLNLDAALRYDIFPSGDLDPQFAPSLGILWQPFPFLLRLRGHAALNYRAPTFVEQYYLNFGNADLKTERSRSINIGGTWQPTDQLVLESSLFLIDTRDRILAIPRSPISWSAQNVGRVVSRGLELGLVGSLFNNLLSGSLSWTLMEAKDRSGGITEGHLLPYSPQEIFNGMITLHRWETALTGTWEYASHRHTLSFNTPQSALPHYLVVNLGVARSFRFDNFQLTGRIDLSNIFNESYQVIRNYPMPGRSLRVETSINWSPHSTIK